MGRFTVAAAIVLSVLLLNFGEVSFRSAWIYKFIILLCAMQLAVAGLVKKKFGWINGIAYLYFSLVGIIYSRVHLFPGLDKIEQKALHLSAAFDTMFLMGSVLFLLAVDARKMRSVYMMAMHLAAFIIVVGGFLVADIKGGVPFIGNPSIAGSFLAVVAVGMWNIYLIIPLVVTIFMLGATTPIAVLYVGMYLRWVILNSRHKFRNAFLLLPVLLVGTIWAVPDLEVGGTGRFRVWELALDQVWEGSSWQKAFGFGMGATPVKMPWAQLQDGYDVNSHDFFMYMHNDWLQIFFETGLVGLVLAALVYLAALRRSYMNRAWFCMLVSYGVAMVTNFPLHSPLFSLLGLVLLGGSFYGRRVHGE